MVEVGAQCPVHFVGSVPLGSIAEVLTTISSAAAGAHVSRLPDGELGGKKGYVSNQRATFERLDAFQPGAQRSDWRRLNSGIQQFALKSLKEVPTVADVGELGHARWAMEAYQTFRDLKQRGFVREETRLKMALPSAYGVLSFFVDRESVPALLPTFIAAIGAEIDRIAEEIPHDQIAIQIDASMEFEALASGDARFLPISVAEAAGQLAQLGATVATDIELGFHCCYGNMNLKHYVEPKDTGDMVAVMNAVCSGLGRPMAFVHMPVPIDRSDDAYFEALKDFRPGSGTELFLGLVHDVDGLKGSLARAAAARRACERFGVGTECGLNHRSRDNVLQIITLLGEVADALSPDMASASR
ncbi:hypothetical protein PY365_26605 [Roseiarcaceae bacterium H3SJ34-1]|uniref:hypothetical protein n=1 Tax=Terripilifer ovatus TaxID=3032367 RepID=UPI003AB91BF4|nr:hypothetical protein [Roseiarcaceae bacterium H3SJ34-1]